MIYKIIILFFFFLPFSIIAQEEFDVDIATLETEEEPEKKWTIDGYIKDLRTIFIDTSGNPLMFNSQIYNRLNFNWYPNEKWTFQAGLRT